MMIILDRLSKAQSSFQGTRLCKDGTHVSLHYSRYRTGNVKVVGYILTVNYGGNKPGDLCITRPGREMATGSIGRFYVQLVLITITSSVCPYLSSPLLHQCQWLRAWEETLAIPRLIHFSSSRTLIWSVRFCIRNVLFSNIVILHLISFKNMLHFYIYEKNYLCLRYSIICFTKTFVYTKIHSSHLTFKKYKFLTVVTHGCIS